MKLPTVLKLDGTVVVFGGGNVGIRKVEYLLNFTRDIIVVAKDAVSLPENVKLIQATINEGNISQHIPKDTSLVVTALSDLELNRKIAQVCRKKGILVNIVDNPEPSTIIFPALSRSGDLNIAISTSGKCPFLASKIRAEIDVNIPLWKRWLELLGPIRESLVGDERKNEILGQIYQNSEIIELINSGSVAQAKNKAEEICNVYRKH